MRFAGVRMASSGGSNGRGAQRGRGLPALVALAVMAGDLVACARAADAPSRAPQATPASLTGGAAAVATSASTAAAAPRMQWAGNFNEALSRAKKERKLILLDFYTDWCGWCKRLDRDVFSQDSFLQAASGIVGVKVNAEKEPQLARQFKVSSYPRLFFLGTDGLVLEQVRGYLNLQDFTAKVKAVQNGETEYSRYKSEAGDPTNLAAGHRFARFLTDSDRVEEAIPYWQQVHDTALQALFETPSNAMAAMYHRDALFELGRNYVSVGLNDVARQHLRECLGAYPGTPQAVEATVMLAEMHAKAGEKDEALSLLRPLVRDYPTSHAAPRGQALLLQLESGARHVVSP